MRTMWLRLTAVTLVAVAGATFAASPSGFQFDIPAGGLKESMERFAATVGADVVFDAFAARDVHTQAIRGEMSPEAALNQMLAGTGLYYSYNAQTRRVILSSRKN